MASIQKFTDDSVAKLLKHDGRQLLHDKNKDIDRSRSHLNYDLTPVRTNPDGRQLSKLEYYRSRKSEVYCYGRSDIKTIAGCVVTLPKEVVDEAEQRQFFESTTAFLSERYGQENIVSVTVHYDEGKDLYLKDGGGELILDDRGKPIREFHLGQPHLHCLFIPVVKIDQKSLMSKKNHVKAMERFEEKISAADVLTKRELKKFHPDLQKHLEKDGIRCCVNSGITREQGGNVRVSDYKKDFDKSHIQALIRENLLLKEQNSKLIEEKARLQEQVKGIEKDSEISGWGIQDAWGKEQSWEKTF